MNIFFLDKNEKIAAQNHCDKHVVKMILESVQMLITTYYISNNINSNKEIKNISELEKIFKNFPLKDNEWNIKYYKMTHINHPSTIWVRNSIENFNWLLKMSNYLCKEYTYRYWKTHKLEKVIQWMKKNKPKLAKKGLTEFPQAMPEKYKSSDSIKSYREYYKGDKVRFAKWTKRNPPNWWINQDL